MNSVSRLASANIADTTLPACDAAKWICCEGILRQVHENRTSYRFAQVHPLMDHR